MKQLQFTSAKEFYEFKKLANMFKLLFTCIVFNGVFFIMADSKDLAELGY